MPRRSVSRGRDSCSPFSLPGTLLPQKSMAFRLGRVYVGSWVPPADEPPTLGRHRAGVIVLTITDATSDHTQTPSATLMHAVATWLSSSSPIANGAAAPHTMANPMIHPTKARGLGVATASPCASPVGPGQGRTRTHRDRHVVAVAAEQRFARAASRCGPCRRDRRCRAASPGVERGVYGRTGSPRRRRGRRGRAHQAKVERRPGAGDANAAGRDDSGLRDHGSRLAMGLTDGHCLAVE